MPGKKLAKEDATEVLLVREALADDPTFGVNVERVLHHEELGWIVFEFLKLGGPYTKPPYKWRDLLAIHESHPNNYWARNGRKFVTLWNVTRELDGTLYLVNYSVREADSAADVPEDRAAQPYTRLPPGSNREEQVYYYVAADKGAHVMEVVDVDLEADFDDPDAEPIETRPIEGSRDGMTWEAFAAWFRDVNRSSDVDPRSV